jgi:hypothetical protein
MMRGINFVCRYPDETHIVEIAQTLGLPNEQAATLHSAISFIVRKVRTLQETKERFGPDSPAVAGLRRISRHLTNAERDLQAADPLIKEVLNSAYLNLGRKLAKARRDPWLDKVSIHHRGEYDKYAKPFSGTYEEIFKARKRDDEEVPDTIHNVKSSITSITNILGKRRVGSPGRVYRNAALEYLVPVYAVIFDKKPTSTAGGQFLLFCELILQAIGLDARGLDKAVAQVLKELRTQKSRPSPQSTPQKG